MAPKIARSLQNICSKSEALVHIRGPYSASFCAHRAQRVKPKQLGMTTGRQYHQTKLPKWWWQMWPDGRQLWDHCRVLRSNVVIYILAEPIVDAKVKSASPQKYRAMWYTGKAGGVKGVEVHHGWYDNAERRMVTFTQSYTKLRRLSQLQGKGSSLPFCPSQPRASQNQRGPYFFFGCAGSSLWEQALPCWGAFSSCGPAGATL